MSKKVLFVRFRKPLNIKDGGELVTQKNYSAFCDLFGVENIEEYYVYPNLKYEGIWSKIKNLPYIFANYYFGLTPRKVNQICEIAQQKDIVFIDRSIFGIIAKELKKNRFKGKIVTFFQNVEMNYYQARYPKYAPYRPLLLHCIDKNDAYAMQYSDFTICFNFRDDNQLQKRYGKKTDAIIPVTFEDKHPSETDVPIANPPTVLFFGAYFPANVDGILWFIDKVLPHINIQLQIVGKGMCKLESKIKKQKSKIKLYSDIENITPFIEQSDFVIFPIFKGSGMKVKTCEALMYGKHIFGTKEAFEGYNVDFDKVGALTNTKEEFIAAIKKYSSGNYLKYNAYSRNFFLENHSEEVIKKRFEKLLLT